MATKYKAAAMSIGENNGKSRPGDFLIEDSHVLLHLRPYASFSFMTLAKSGKVPNINSTLKRRYNRSLFIGANHDL